MMKRIEVQSHFMRGLLLVTDVAPGALEPQLKRVLAEADANLTVTSVRPMQQQVDRSFDQQRAVASLAGLFGIVALVLAAIGLYGVTAYSVAQRTNEIGIRMALGADRGNVVGMVLQGAFRRVAIGLLLGLPLAVGAGYFLSAQLYGVEVLGSAGARGRRRRAGRIRVRRRDHPGEPGGVDRADHGLAHRLNRGFYKVLRGSAGSSGFTRFCRTQNPAAQNPAEPVDEPGGTQWNLVEPCQSVEPCGTPECRVH